MLREEVSILVIDDVNSMRLQIRELLRSFGFRRITMVGSGEEAKQVLKGEEVHLVLSDWHMEPTNGIELLKYIRTLPNAKEISFILVTAETTKEKVIEAIKAGVDDYLIKPLTLQQIQNKVYGVLLRKQVLS